MRVITKNFYYCDYCGKYFDNNEDCKAHEEAHTTVYNEATNEEIITELLNFANNAWNYRNFGRVCGMPYDNFQNLLRVAAERLKEV